MKRRQPPTTPPQTVQETEPEAAAARPDKPHNHSPLTALIIVLTSIATLLVYRAVQTQYSHGLRRSVAQHLQELFPEALVYVGNAYSSGPRKIVLTNVRLCESQTGQAHSVFSAERVELVGDLDIVNWAQETTAVHQVNVQACQLDAWVTKKGHWSWESLEPCSDPKRSPPAITIRSGSLRIHNGLPGDTDPLVIHDISGAVAHQQARQPNTEQPTAHHNPPARVRLTGTSSGVLRKVALDGYWIPAQGSWRVEGHVEKLQFSPRLIQRLPAQLQGYVGQLAGLECELSNDFEVKSVSGSKPEFELRGSLTDGRLRDRRLPYPLEQVNGWFYCNNAMLQLRSLTAVSGITSLQLSSDIMGFDINSPVEIHAQTTNLELDQRLKSALPASLQEAWGKLQVSGSVSGTIRLNYDGSKWTPSAQLQCAGVSIVPWLFPYPLSDINGPIKYSQGTVSSPGLTGLAGGQVVFSSFSLTKADDQWYGSMNGLTEGAVAIDQQLLRALTPRDKPVTGAEKFVRSLSPTGVVQLRHFEFRRDSPEDPKWHRTIDANVYSASITYEKFRYPIEAVRGRIYGQDQQWLLSDFEGRNDSGRILCKGNWSVIEDEVPFNINFQAYAVPIEDELRAALPADGQRVWDQLRPSGSLDAVSVDIFRPLHTQNIQTRVEIEEDSSSNSTTRQSLRLHPSAFPYMLSDVDCHIEYTPGLVLIKRAAGYNGSSRIALQGTCAPTSGGNWKADVQWLPSTRVIVNRELLQALPRSVRDSVVKIDFHGPISLLGDSQMVFSAAPDTSPYMAWNCQVDIENGSLADGKNIDNLRGTVYMQGSSDGTRRSVSGSIAMDALTVRGVPVADLRGPFRLVDNTLYFGGKAFDAVPAVGNPESPIMSANALAGQLTVEGFGRLDSGKFFLDAQLRDAELSSLLQEVGVRRASTVASCDASLTFEGIPWDPQRWSGEGEIHLSDAKLFELPFMIRLMRAASVDAKDDSAFRSADIQFQIYGDRVPLQVACDGDVLRLRGEGETNLRGEIDLELYSYVGRRPITAVLSPMLGESRYATLMLIKVDGTLDNPNMQRQTFPQLAGIQYMFPELSEKQ